MHKPISTGRLLAAVLKKDIRIYSRNSIYLFLTILSLVFFVAIFWIVPDSVDEELPFAITPPLSVIFAESKTALETAGIPVDDATRLAELESTFKEEGLQLIEFAGADELQRAISGELLVYKTAEGGYIFLDPELDQKAPKGASKVNLGVGISFPPTFFSAVLLQQKPQVTVYADAAVPEEIRGAMQGFVRELAFSLAGKELPVELPPEDTIILGRDRVGEQISMRARMRPLIAFFIMMMETFALASLISNEVLQRTVTALLVTPLRVGHFLLAKTIFGTILALIQAVIVLVLVGAFTVDNWLLLLLIVLLGSLIFTAVAMLVGSAGKDFIGQLMFSLLFLIPLMIPAFAVLFPGSVASWVRVLPSYPIVKLLYDVTIHETLWADSLALLGNAALWSLVIFAAGLFVLKRKVATL
ncbi:MAG: ABC transporter permease [Firmicutes bacterium]|nr:ABC transporter permease [Bacillota bacterium]